MAQQVRQVEYYPASIPKVIVGTEVHRRDGFPVIAKKGQPALDCLRLLGARFIPREIVRFEISKPSMRTSPWMRGAPPS